MVTRQRGKPCLLQGDMSHYGRFSRGLSQEPLELTGNSEPR
jgi:hypothetical protein